MPQIHSNRTKILGTFIRIVIKILFKRQVPMVTENQLQLIQVTNNRVNLKLVALEQVLVETK